MLGKDGTAFPVYPEDPDRYAAALATVGDRILFWRGTSAITEGTLWISDPKGQRRQLLNLAHSAAFSLGCGPDACFVTATHDGGFEVRQLDLSDGGLGRPLVSLTGYPGRPAVSPDGRRVALPRDATISILDRRTGKVVDRTAPGLSALSSAAFLGDDLLLTDSAFQPGGFALLRLHPDGRLDVVAQDGGAYYAPSVDAVRHRIVIQHQRSHARLRYVRAP